MPKLKADNRTRLLHAAEKATYQYGFGRTAIADIAKEARVPLGNVYYYFKTKDEIADAIVQLRVTRFKKLLQELDPGRFSGREAVRVRADKDQEPGGTGAQRLSCRNPVLRTAKARRRGRQEVEGIVRGGPGMDGGAI